MNNDKEVNSDDHPIYRKLDEDFCDDGLKFREDSTKPIGDDAIFLKIVLFVKKLVQDKGLPLRRKDYRGGYSWLSTEPMGKSGETLLKLNYYGEDDYFWGIREAWTKSTGIHDRVLKLCSYRFVVQPKTDINFIGFPCKGLEDLDKIEDIIQLIPKDSDLSQ